MAEIEAALLEKVHTLEGAQEPGTLVGFLRPRKKRIGTLIEAKDGQSLKNLKREVKKKGGKKLKLYQEINTLYAEMPVEHVSELASVACAQKVYDAEGDVKLTLNQSVPLVMGVEKWQLPYRFKHRKLEGQGVKVAVIDSGIDKKHPDFAWRIKKVKNFSGGRKYKGVEHGTHVAGIIGGSGKVSGYRYVGVAPRVNLYVGKVFINSETPTSRPIIIDAILWAVRKKVDIINMSFGDNQGCSDGTCILCKTADYASRQGVTVVAAAGNGGPAENTISCPGNAGHAITVGATTKTKPIVVAGFSGRGSLQQPNKPDIVAPGDRIIAPQPGHQYVSMSGTSMAVPHVSGITALLYQAARRIHQPNRLTPKDVKQFLIQAGNDLGEHASAQGNGLINFERELDVLQLPKKSSRFSLQKGSSKKLVRRQPSPIVQLAQTNVLAGTETCPSVLHGFCPHYEEQACNTLYADCIHYKAANQVQALKNIKLAPSQESDEVIPLLIPGSSPQKQPGTTSIRGHVAGMLTGIPLSGISVTLGNISTETDTEGNFSLSRVPKGIYPLTLTSDKIYPRRVIVDTTTWGKLHVTAIEQQSAFHLNFYRELVRGNHPYERAMYPICRWNTKQPPTFYINTESTRTLEGKVKRSSIRITKHVIKKILPVFSGGLFQKPPIKVARLQKTEFKDIPDYSIVITFDDYIITEGAFGIALPEPDIGKGAIKKIRIYIAQHPLLYHFREGRSLRKTMAHELGHAFGFRHTIALPSIMELGPRNLPENLFTEHDRLHMKIAYSRPVGNTDIDNDPAPSARIHKHFTQPEVFIEWLTEPPKLPCKLQKKLKHVPESTLQLFQEAGITT